MGRNKKYYFMKLKEDLLEMDELQWLTNGHHDEGYKYFYLYICLCLRSLRDNGKIVQTIGTEEVPYDINGLCRLSGLPASTVEAGLHRLMHAQLIEYAAPDPNPGALYVTHFEEMVGSETDSAIRMRKMRQNRQASERMKKMRSSKKNGLLEGTKSAKST